LKTKYFWRWLGRVCLERLQGRLGGLSRRGQERLARVIARILWLFQRRQRTLMLALMRQALGDKLSESELLELRRAAYLNMARVIVEVLRMPSLSKQQLHELVRLEGEEHLQQALAKGKGVIIITAHFGNWELFGARLVEACGAGRFDVIAQPQRDLQLTRLIDSIRLKHGVKVIARGNAARETLRALKHGEAVGILLDLDMKDKGIFTEFLGRPASTASGPAAFALRTGATVISAFDYRQPEGTHVGCLGAPIEITNTGNWENDLRENTARFTEVIEKHVRARPDHWVWIPDRWRTRPAEEGER
jgi:KDO2-lipid IV(A) lauroyltransferase